MQAAPQVVVQAVQVAQVVVHLVALLAVVRVPHLNNCFA